MDGHCLSDQDLFVDISTKQKLMVGKTEESRLFDRNRQLIGWEGVEWHKILICVLIGPLFYWFVPVPFGFVSTTEHKVLAIYLTLQIGFFVRPFAKPTAPQKPKKSLDLEDNAKTEEETAPLTDWAGVGALSAIMVGLMIAVLRMDNELEGAKARIDGVALLELIGGILSTSCASISFANSGFPQWLGFHVIRWLCWLSGHPTLPEGRSRSASAVSSSSSLSSNSAPSLLPTHVESKEGTSKRMGPLPLAYAICLVDLICAACVPLVNVRTSKSHPTHLIMCSLSLTLSLADGIVLPMAVAMMRAYHGGSDVTHDQSLERYLLMVIINVRNTNTNEWPYLIQCSQYLYLQFPIHLHG